MSNYNDYNYDIDRRIMERDDMFGISSRENYKKNGNMKKYSSFKNVGEITGHILNNDITKGMPLRPINEEKIEDDYDYTNPKLDFDLYESKPNLKDISYFDPYDFSQISEINHEDNILNLKRFDISNSINELAIILLNNSSNIFFSISPLALVQSLVVLYRGSKGETEQNIKNNFSFSDKNTTFSDFSNLLEELRYNFITSFSYLYFPRKLSLNYGYLNYISGVGIVNNINKDNYGFINKINEDVYEKTKKSIGSVLQKKDILYKDDIISLNTFTFYCEWKYSFNIKNTKKVIFNGKPMDMMFQYEMMYDYYRDDNNSLLEIDYSNDQFKFGILLSRNNNLFISKEQLYHYIGNLGQTKIKALCIPKFKKITKINISNLFNKLEISKIFQNMDLTEISPNNNSAFIDPFIQKNIFMTSEQGKISRFGNKTLDNNGIKFMAIKPFVYYVRHIPSNSILLIGKFY